MDRDIDLFFAPRPIDLQGKLDFLSTPPERIICLPHEATDFCGLMLHWNGSESVLCTGAETCPLHARGNPVRPYYYTAAYAHDHGSQTWKRCVFAVGADVARFAEHQLKGRAFKVRSRIDKYNRKKGIAVAPYAVPESVVAYLATLETFDIRQRILSRYQMA